MDEAEGMSVAGPSAAAQLAPFVWDESIVDSFPPAFRAFLVENDVHPHNYAVDDVPRYIRVSPRASVSREQLEQQLGAACEPVDWLAGYYMLSASVKIAGVEAYRSGHIYGIDLASGAAVAALGVQPGDHVLDMCCAPGAKLCAIGDALGLSGSVTGVDVSAERLNACRTLCRKYGISNARLLLADATQFCTTPPALRGAEVDAECTHDGSIKHLAKFAQWGWDTFERRFLQPERLATLRRLQAELLRAGFRNLRNGGSLVYCTCSFARAQNEDVVAALLEADPRAQLVPIDGMCGAPCRPGGLPHTLRFDPRASRTSALFVAKIMRRGLAD